MEKIYRIKEQLICGLEQEMSGGFKSADTQEAGQVIDMIKDLAEVEKACAEAEYYMAITEAMEEAKEYDYDYNAYGYMPMDMPGQTNYRIGYDQHRVYGYDNNGSFGQTQNQANSQMNKRMGYNRQSNNGYGGKMRSSSRMSNRYGYNDEALENLKTVMENASPEQREKLKKDAYKMIEDLGM